MEREKSKILPIILSVIVLSMLISPTYPTLNNAYAAPPETPTLDVKCQAEGNSNKPVTADCQLLNLLNEEIANRIAADDTLQGNIDAEEAARITADDTLQGNIDDEETARILADGALQDNINDLSSRIDAISAQGNSLIDTVVIILDTLAFASAAAGVACVATIFAVACGPGFAAVAIASEAAAVALRLIDFI